MNNLGSIIFLITLFLVSLFLSWYAFQALRTVLSDWEGPFGKSAWYAAYWLVFGVYILFLMMTFISIVQKGEISTRSQSFLNIWLTVTITQLTVIIFLFGEDVIRGIAGGSIT